MAFKHQVVRCANSICMAFFEAFVNYESQIGEESAHQAQSRNASESLLKMLVWMCRAKCDAHVFRYEQSCRSVCPMRSATSIEGSFLIAKAKFHMVRLEPIVSIQEKYWFILDAAISANGSRVLLLH